MLSINGTTFIRRGLSEFCHETAPLPSTLVLGYGGLPTEQVQEAAARLKSAWEGTLGPIRRIAAEKA